MLYKKEYNIIFKKNDTLRLYLFLNSSNVIDDVISYYSSIKPLPPISLSLSANSPAPN